MLFFVKTILIAIAYLMVYTDIDMGRKEDLRMVHAIYPLMVLGVPKILVTQTEVKIKGIDIPLLTQEDGEPPLTSIHLDDGKHNHWYRKYGVESTARIFIDMSLQKASQEEARKRIRQADAIMPEEGYFIIYTDDLPQNYLDQDLARALVRHYFGRPERQYHVGRVDEQAYETRGLVEIYRRRKRIE